MSHVHIPVSDHVVGQVDDFSRVGIVHVYLWRPVAASVTVYRRGVVDRARVNTDRRPCRIPETAATLATTAATLAAAA